MSEWKRLDLTDMPKDLTACEFRKNHGTSTCDMHWQDALVDMPDERIEYRMKPKAPTLDDIKVTEYRRQVGDDFITQEWSFGFTIGFRAGRSDEYKDVEV